MPSRLVWAVVLAGLLLTLIAWRESERVGRQVAEAHFQAEAMQRSLLIGKQFETTGSALEDLAALFAANDAVSVEQFTRFVRPILARQPSIQALSWNVVVSQAERDTHEAAMRQAGWAGYRILVRSPEGDLVPAPERDEYVVVSVIEPYEGNQSALGFDVSSQNTRLEALQRARDTAAFSIAAPISLVQGEGESPGALGFLPRYRSGLVVDTVAERRAAIEGYFVAVIDVAKNIAAALSSMDTSEFELTVLSTSPSGVQFVLYEFPQPPAGVASSGSAASDRPSYTTTFPWAEHEIEVRFVASDAFLTGSPEWVPLGVLLAGLLLTVLAASVAGVLWGRTVRIASEVADRTQELQDANSELQEEVARRVAVEERLEDHHRKLARTVEERTAELRATSAQLRTVVESEPECVKIVSADGKLENMNAAGLAMIEADSIDQVRGCDVYALVADKDREAFIDLNRRVIAGESLILEFELHGLRGGQRLVETHAVPLVDPESGETRHLAITRDITAKRAVEREQAELENQLRQKQKLESIGIMAGGIAHDFNNILQVIIGNCETALARTDIDDETRRSIEASYHAATDAAKLCDQMLTYAGRTRQDMKSVDLHDLVTSMDELLRVSHSKNAELEVEFEDGLNMINGDDAQIRQIVVNLVQNASDAIGDAAGQIVIRVQEVELSEQASGDEWIESAPSAGRYISLEVSDTGCGMDAETRGKIFDPFFTTKLAGRGLGLSSTLGIIRGHEGHLSVVSGVSNGTRFTVLFPVADDTDDAALTASKPEPTSFDETIMIVDDQEEVRKVGSRVLEWLGCRVIAAASGEEAVRRFTDQADTIDAVLLDVAMPRMDGNATGRALRRIRPDIPIIFCSGFADDAVQAGIDSVGFTGFLHKPYGRDDLARVLHEAFSGEAELIKAPVITRAG